MTETEEKQMTMDLKIKEAGERYNRDLTVIARCIARLEEAKTERTQEYEKEFITIVQGK